MYLLKDYRIIIIVVQLPQIQQWIGKMHHSEYTREKTKAYMH